MAAPTPTGRNLRTPTGDKLTDGKTAFVVIGAGSSYRDIAFWEVTVKPQGYDGGEPVMTGDMWNTAFKTKVPQKLINGTPMQIEANYDPAFVNDIVAAINDNTTITRHDPDLSSTCFYGYLRSVEFAPMADGQQPRCTIVIEQTNTDPSDGSEAGPVYTPPP